MIDDSKPTMHRGHTDAYCLVAGLGGQARQSAGWLLVSCVYHSYKRNMNESRAWRCMVLRVGLLFVKQ